MARKKKKKHAEKKPTVAMLFKNKKFFNSLGNRERHVLNSSHIKITKYDSSGMWEIEGGGSHFIITYNSPHRKDFDIVG